MTEIFYTMVKIWMYCCLFVLGDWVFVAHQQGSLNDILSCEIAKPFIHVWVFPNEGYKLPTTIDVDQKCALQRSWLKTAR